MTLYSKGLIWYKLRWVPMNFSPDIPMKTTKPNMNLSSPAAIPATEHPPHAYHLNNTSAILYTRTFPFLANPLPGNIFRL